MGISRRRTNLALAALASAGFVYVTAETAPIGLLPQLSHGLHVSAGAVGLLVSIYAGVAGLAAIPVTAWTTRVPKGRLVMGALSLLTLTQFGVALAPDYAVVMGLRAICAVAHGVFWAVIAIVAADLDVPGRAGRATAIVFAGNSLAVVAGTPLVNALGTSLGWRPAEAVIAGAGVLVTAAVAAFVPLGAGAGAGAGARAGSALGSISGAARNGALLAICATTALVVLGHYSVYTYITRLIEHNTGLTGLAVAAVLFAFGAAGVVGNGLAGATLDRWPRPTVFTVVALVAASLAVIGLAGRGATVVTIVAMIAWGAAFTAFPTCLQAGVLRVAPEHPETASAIFVVAFQIGIGGGALLGSVLVDGGHLGALPFLGAVIAAGGLAVLVVFRQAIPRRGHERHASMATVQVSSDLSPASFAQPVYAKDDQANRGQDH
jgi:predicted MFS family arabinose efflux permease